MSEAVEQVMAPYHQANRFTLYEGDCRYVLPIFPDDHFDSIVCDPPYELGFMGKGWDRSGIAYDVSVWRECLRVLKPGGHLLAFGGSRTYHRLACAIEDAGFEIRDDIDFWYDANPLFAALYDSLTDKQKELLHASAGASHLSWLYGSGFPKSLDVSKAIDAAAGAKRERIGSKIELGVWNSKKGQPGQHEGWQRPWMQDEDADAYHVTIPATEAAKQWEGWGTALKPAHEPIVLARKPLIGTVAENVLEHGTGGLNVDGCRIETGDKIAPFGSPRKSVGGLLNKVEEALEGYEQSDLGRWPANVIHDGSDEVLAGFPETQSGFKIGGQYAKDGMFAMQRDGEVCYNDSGNAARFFYCAKATQEDRNEGLNGLVSIVIQWPKCDTSSIDSENAVRLLVDTGSLPLKATVESGIQHRSVIAWSTSWFGSKLTALYQTECKSTTRTNSNSITVSRISSSLMRYLTSVYMVDVNCETANGGSPAASAESSIRFQLTTSAKTASVLGVENVPSPARFRISVSDARNFHSTVKPVDLMRYLVRLITPPGGLVLDPFCGSGSTGKAAMLEGLRFVGIELNADYCELAQRRIEAVTKQGLLFA